MRLSVEELFEHFSAFGKIVDLVIIKDKQTGNGG